MARLLAVPNFSTAEIPTPWSVGRLLGEDLKLHYAQGDPDHERSVIAFSGEPVRVLGGMMSLCEALLPDIDLALQRGVHPRVGALDVAPFIDISGDAAMGIAEDFAAAFSERFDIAVEMYEHSAIARRGKVDPLPVLRKRPIGWWDYGPATASRRWGRTIVGARDFLIAANLDFSATMRKEVYAAAREIRRLREAGEPKLRGVRALAFDLRRRGGGAPEDEFEELQSSLFGDELGEVQLSFNLSQPDETSFDAVATIGERLVGAPYLRTELIGVIRERDLPGATRLTIDPAQVVDR